MGEPSSFTVSTLPGAKRRMSLELRGRALPYQPIDFEGSMRAEFTWYPGNAVASVQMLGAEEKTTVIKGMWKDRFIKSVTDAGTLVTPTGMALVNGRLVDDVYDLMLKVEKIRLAGQLLEVKWDRIVRHGIMLRFRQSWARIEDMEWEMEFQWVSRGEAQRPPSIPLAETAGDWAAEIKAKFDSLVASIQANTVFQVVESFTSAVSTYAAQIDDAVVAIQNGAQNVVNQFSSAQEAAERALTAAESVKAGAIGIIDTIESIPPLDLIKTATAEGLTLGDALLASSYTRRIKDDATAMAVYAATQGDTLRAIARQEQLLGVFTARQPSDLRDVSSAYYGMPDNWRKLLLYNNLSSSKLTVGQIILVPKLTSDMQAA